MYTPLTPHVDAPFKLCNCLFDYMAGLMCTKDLRSGLIDWLAALLIYCLHLKFFNEEFL